MMQPTIHKRLGMAMAMLLLASPLSLHAAGAPETQTYEISVTLEGIGLERTHWHSFRKAQLKLALKLPSQLHAKTTQTTHETEVRVMETLAQFVRAEVVSQNAEVTDQVEWTGPGHTPRAEDLDTQGNLPGTRYQVNNTFRFTVVKAEQAERAKMLLEQESLLEEINALRSNQGHIPTEQLLTINQRLPLELLPELSLDSGLDSTSLDEILAGKSGHQVENSPERVFLSGLDQEARREAMVAGNREYNFYRSQHLARKRHGEDGRGGYREAVEQFIDQLPIYWAQTIQPIEAQHQRITVKGSLGADLYFNQDVAQQFGGITHKPDYQLEMVTVNLRNTCVLPLRQSSGGQGPGINLCEAWRSLPKEYRTLIENEGLYRGGRRMERHELINLVQGTGYETQLMMMPTVERNQGGSYPNIPAGRSWDLRKNGNLAAFMPRNFKGGVTAGEIYGLNRSVPDLLAAGFYGRDPVTVTIMFPNTGEFIDVQLNSDQYLTRPNAISVMLYDPSLDPGEYRLRADSVRVQVWWPGTGEGHPAEGMTEIGQGQRHHASLPHRTDDYSVIEHMRFIRDYMDDMKTTVSGTFGEDRLSHPVEGMSVMAACGGWLDEYIDNRLCNNHLILAVGQVPAFSNRGENRLPWLPSTRLNAVNDPMQPLKHCKAMDPSTYERVACEDYFSSLDLTLTARGAGVAVRHRVPRFWDHAQDQAVLNGARQRPLSKREGWQLIFDPYMNDGHFSYW